MSTGETVTLQILHDYVKQRADKTDWDLITVKEEILKRISSVDISLSNALTNIRSNVDIIQGVVATPINNTIQIVTIVGCIAVVNILLVLFIIMKFKKK